MLEALTQLVCAGPVLNADHAEAVKNPFILDLGKLEGVTLVLKIVYIGLKADPGSLGITCTVKCAELNRVLIRLRE